MVTQTEPGNYHRLPTPCCKCTSQQWEDQWSISHSLWLAHSRQVYRGKTVSLNKLHVSFCIINRSVQSKLEFVVFPPLLWEIKSLYLPALILDALDWTMSTERGVMKAFSQERRAGKRGRNGKFILLGVWICVGWEALCTEGCRSTPVSAQRSSSLQRTQRVLLYHCLRKLFHFILITLNTSHILILCLLFSPLLSPAFFTSHEG